MPGETFIDDPFLRLREVEREVGLSRSAIYRRISAGGFPAPLQMGGGVVRWPLSVIRAWKGRIEGRVDAIAPPPPEEKPAEPRRRGRPRLR